LSATGESKRQTGIAITVRLKPDPTGNARWSRARPLRQRPEAPVKQTIEVGVTASEGKTREPATSARSEPAPSARAVNNKCRRRVLPRRPSCLRHRCFRTLALVAGLNPCATVMTVHLKPDPTENGPIRSIHDSSRSDPVLL